MIMSVVTRKPVLVLHMKRIQKRPPVEIKSKVDVQKARAWLQTTEAREALQTAQQRADGATKKLVSGNLTVSRITRPGYNCI
jgi:hypothetical protein